MDFFEGQQDTDFVGQTSLQNLSKPSNIFDHLVNLVLAVADPPYKHKALTILA